MDDEVAKKLSGFSDQLLDLVSIPETDLGDGEDIDNIVKQIYALGLAEGAKPLPPKCPTTTNNN